MRNSLNGDRKNSICFNHSQKQPLFFLLPFTLVRIKSSCSLIIIGRHHKRYSVMAITLCYDFALPHNTFIPYIIVIASSSYRSVYIGPVIALIVIALMLYTSVFPSIRYCFWGHSF
jgi:hypothetical protein